MNLYATVGINYGTFIGTEKNSKIISCRNAGARVALSWHPQSKINIFLENSWVQIGTIYDTNYGTSWYKLW